MFINIYATLKSVIQEWGYIQNQKLQLLPIKDYYNNYHIKVQTQTYYIMVKYANNLICIMCVFLNINKNFKK